MTDVRDLSTVHEPLGALFTAPSGEELESFRLTDDQVAHYEEYGYVAGIRVLTDEQIELLREELAGLIDPEHPGHHLFHEYHSNESVDPSRVLFHALGAWRVTPGFHDLIFHPAITVPASQLLGGSVRFWHDQLFCKPARHGGVVAWHQDYSYWTRTEPLAHLTCWVGLDDADRSNGCVRYLPGSHRWDLLPITGLAGDMDAICEVLTEEQVAAFEAPVDIELQQGYATFHHPLMIHGSQENVTERRRRATVVNMFRDGVRSATDEPLLEGVPVIAAGDKLGGQFFPLLQEV
ncbi:MAG: phytanoyl-CoA dioxygenase family protein [Planctomycetota bacterium]|nr:MAG: phytanoyl-CoA dioxygenase family protein [Planctomycetota bacterium]REJ87892.1 MAG: phytanoyl-CoA dioxygenase family protein [Planctomycetota bacterium]REK26468.1 MAG: phytanoyl-CoA dioxygenase family protein [Planctomycetota bacterium]REK38694.1 MAG: phytanoyl-CoA dioxygenase family protein [Planctomycetota bacterium]